MTAQASVLRRSGVAVFGRDVGRRRLPEARPPVPAQLFVRAEKLASQHTPVLPLSLLSVGAAERGSGLSFARPRLLGVSCFAIQRRFLTLRSFRSPAALTIRHEARPARRVHHLQHLAVIPEALDRGVFDRSNEIELVRSCSGRVISWKSEAVLFAEAAARSLDDS